MKNYKKTEQMWKDAANIPEQDHNEVILKLRGIRLPKYPNQPTHTPTSNCPHPKYSSVDNKYIHTYIYFFFKYYPDF